MGLAVSPDGILIREGATNATATKTLEEDALRWMVKWELDSKKQTSMTANSITTASSSTPFRTFPNCGKTWYVDGVLVGRLSVNYYVYKDDDQDPSYDYFGIQPDSQIDSGSYVVGNIWENHPPAVLKHSIAYSPDLLKSASPTSQSDTSTFTVQLTAPYVSWTFSPGESADLDTETDIVAKYNKFTFSPGGLFSGWSNHQNYKPGTAWASYGSHLLGLDTHYELIFRDQWGPNDVIGTFDYRVTASY